MLYVCLLTFLFIITIFFTSFPLLSVLRPCLMSDSPSHTTISPWLAIDLDLFPQHLSPQNFEHFIIWLYQVLTFRCPTSDFFLCPSNLAHMTTHPADSSEFDLLEAELFPKQNHFFSQGALLGSGGYSNIYAANPVVTPASTFPFPYEGLSSSPCEYVLKCLPPFEPFPSEIHTALISCLLPDVFTSHTTPPLSYWFDLEQFYSHFTPDVSLSEQTRQSMVNSMTCLRELAISLYSSYWRIVYQNDDNSSRHPLQNDEAGVHFNSQDCLLPLFGIFETTIFLSDQSSGYSYVQPNQRHISLLLPRCSIDLQTIITFFNRVSLPMPSHTVTTILRSITRALQILHYHRIVHRDVKPSNILLTDSGHTFLADFGSGRFFPQIAPLWAKNTPSHSINRLPHPVDHYIFQQEPFYAKLFPNKIVPDLEFDDGSSSDPTHSVQDNHQHNNDQPAVDLANPRLISPHLPQSSSLLNLSAIFYRNNFLPVVAYTPDYIMSYYSAPMGSVLYRPFDIILDNPDYNIPSSNYPAGAIDIWALGCIAFQLWTNSPCSLFSDLTSTTAQPCELSSLALLPAILALGTACGVDEPFLVSSHLTLTADVQAEPSYPQPFKSVDIAKYFSSMPGFMFISSYFQSTTLPATPSLQTNHRGRNQFVFACRPLFTQEQGHWSAQRSNSTQTRSYKPPDVVDVAVKRQKNFSLQSGHAMDHVSLTTIDHSVSSIDYLQARGNFLSYTLALVPDFRPSASALLSHVIFAATPSITHATERVVKAILLFQSENPLLLDGDNYSDLYEDDDWFFDSDKDVEIQSPIETNPYHGWSTLLASLYQHFQPE